MNRVDFTHPQTPVWERWCAKLCFVSVEGLETEFRGHAFPNGSFGTRPKKLQGRKLWGSITAQMWRA
jgi:hypothetical protein